MVVNTHLYATSLAIKEAELLPPHDLVVFDEAHELEDIASAAFGFDLNHGRLVALARLARPLVAERSVVAGLEDTALLLVRALLPYRDRAVPRPLDEDLARVVNLVRERASRLLEELRRASRQAGAGQGRPGAPGNLGPAPPDDSEAGGQARRQRATKAAAHLIDDANEILELPETQIAWVEGPARAGPASGAHRRGRRPDATALER